MTRVQTLTTFICDWTDEHGDICGERLDVKATEARDSNAFDHARGEGWGSYANAYIRRNRWTTGANLIFCPVHATVFRNNHGWGDLERYEPPHRWWRNFYRAGGTR